MVAHGASSALVSAVPARPSPLGAAHRQDSAGVSGVAAQAPSPAGGRSLPPSGKQSGPGALADARLLAPKSFKEIDRIRDSEALFSVSDAIGSRGSRKSLF